MYGKFEQLARRRSIFECCKAHLIAGLLASKVEDWRQHGHGTEVAAHFGCCTTKVKDVNTLPASRLYLSIIRSIMI